MLFLGAFSQNTFNFIYLFYYALGMFKITANLNEFSIYWQRQNRTEPLNKEVLLINNRRYENNYKFRFDPIVLIPRLFWDKTKLKPTSPATTSTTSKPTTSKPTTTIEITTTNQPEITTTVEQETTTTTTTSKPHTTKVPTTNTSTSTTTTTTTTTSTIGIKPPKPHNIKPTKNFLLYGSLKQINLLRVRNKTKTRGFLNLFELTNIENRKCTVNLEGVRTMDGICYHDIECKSFGGISTVSCAEGVGVCCIFLNSCGDLTDQSIVYFESPDYPKATSDTLLCVLTVNLRKNVQQLRLDFLMFELSRPTEGNCIDDQFIVSGQDVNAIVPILCGINTGQHLYVAVGDSIENKIYLSFFGKTPKIGRLFNLKVTQLEGDLAPVGCLQYYKESEGILKSFNYDVAGTVIIDNEATYLNNLNYAICIERLKKMCSVTYQMAQMTEDRIDFQIVNKDEENNDLVPLGQAGAGIFNCPDDFIAINQIRLCGERFNDGTENEDYSQNAQIRDTMSGPIILPFRTDDVDVGRGFYMIYKQELCN